MIKNLIAINRHRVVFTKEGNRVMLTLLIDPDTQLNYFIEEEDFKLVPKDDVDYDWILFRIKDRNRGRMTKEEYRIVKNNGDDTEQVLPIKSI